MENTIRQYRLSQRLYTDVITSRSEVRAIDVDGANNLVYWTDPVRKAVFRSWVPTKASEVSLPQYLNIYLDIVPEGIAYDWIGKNIYITDAKAGRIVVGTADGRYLKTIVDPSTRRPTRIAVSSTLGMMFWVDTVNKKIESAWMDGTNIRTLVSINISDVTSIVVDHYMSSRLFWTDAKRNVIESSKVDGTDRVIVTHQALSNPFAVDVFQAQMFWVSQRNRSLYEFDKFGRGINITHSIVQQNIRRPTDVKVHHVQKQPPVSASLDRCASKGCYPLCVLVPNGARCMCPDGDSFTRPNTCNSAMVAKLELPKPCVCLNGGTCSLQSDLLSVFCLCPPAFIGIKCENSITTRAMPTVSTPKPTWLPPLITTPHPAGSTTDKEVTKGPGPGKGGSGENQGKVTAGKGNDLTAVIVPVVIVIVILAIIIVIVLVLYRRGVIGTKSGGGGVFRPGAPGLTGNGNDDNHYETPVVTFDPKDGGQANASFENPYYSSVHPNNNEAMGVQEYATAIPMKS